MNISNEIQQFDKLEIDFDKFNEWKYNYEVWK